MEESTLTAPVNPLQSEVDRLLGQLRMARNNHASDINTIGERLIELAEAKGWCSEYDEEIEKLNADLCVPLPTRSHEYIATFTVTVEFESTDASASDIMGDIQRDLEYRDCVTAVEVKDEPEVI